MKRDILWARFAPGALLFGLLAGLALLIWMALWALASRLRPDRQFWHDAWAGTSLIQD